MARAWLELRRFCRERPVELVEDIRANAHFGMRSEEREIKDEVTESSVGALQSASFVAATMN